VWLSDASRTSLSHGRAPSPRMDGFWSGMECVGLDEGFNQNSQL
jgi:hypothetical protein